MEVGPVTRRIAVAGSVSAWPAAAAWDALVTDALDLVLERMPPGSTLIVRYGAADRGPDSVASRWGGRGARAG